MTNSPEAVNHVNRMKELYGAEISNSIKHTTIHRNDVDISMKDKEVVMNFKVDSVDTVYAALKYHNCKTAVLNFASYKNPGGGFIHGSHAQEEDLCGKSTLYPVLFVHINYYETNRKNINKGLYSNAALYSEDIVFNIDHVDFKCDVITCAAPNWSAARRNGVTRSENSRALKERIEFMLKVAVSHDVDTLILGAWGCGVFKQDSAEVAELFQNALHKYPYFKTVVFAVPGGVNLEAFKNTFA